MAARKTGISRELIIHPGETISDILEIRNITQSELADRAGVSAAYVNKVISGKQGISSKFAMALEYTLDIPKSFWLNLQARYDAEVLEADETLSITESEINVRNQLNDIVKYLRNKKMIPVGEKKIESILSIRKALRVSNLCNLEKISTISAFRMGNTENVNPYVMGAWVRICQILGETSSITQKFDINSIDNLVLELKRIMLNAEEIPQQDLKMTLNSYGIDFTIVRHFRGAPVQGFINKKADGTYQICMTLRRSFADIFWFSLFHEIGHIANGDLFKSKNFIDDGTDIAKEKRADKFAGDTLLNPDSYDMFIKNNDFSLPAILSFAEKQGVAPYIVIGRLQKEKRLGYHQYPQYKLRYKWLDSFD